MARVTLQCVWSNNWLCHLTDEKDTRGGGASPTARIAIERHQNESILYCLYLEGGVFVASLLPTRGKKNLHIQYCDVNAMFDCPEAFNRIGCLFFVQQRVCQYNCDCGSEQKMAPWFKPLCRWLPNQLANLVCCDGDVVGGMPTPSSWKHSTSGLCGWVAVSFFFRWIWNKST